MITFGLHTHFYVLQTTVKFLFLCEYFDTSTVTPDPPKKQKNTFNFVVCSYWCVTLVKIHTWTEYVHTYTLCILHLIATIIDTLRVAFYKYTYIASKEHQIVHLQFIVHQHPQ